MIIPCLPTDTAYDVTCPVCGRGFLLMVDPFDVADQSALRRTAKAALAAQHRSPSQKSTRRQPGRDRRVGRPDPRAVQIERRGADRDRRQQIERRGVRPEGLRSADERRTAALAYRRGSGAAHPRTAFDLHTWESESEHAVPPPDGFAVVMPAGWD